jgi:hypothetical protein
MTFEAYYNKTKLAGMIAISLLFGLGGWWMIGQNKADYDVSSVGRLERLAALLGMERVTLGHAVGWVLLVMGILGAFVYLSDMLHKDAAIRIDQRGIYSKGWSSEPIAWSNVARIEPKLINKQEFVQIYIADAGANPPATWLRKKTSHFSFGKDAMVTLILSGTDGDYDDMLACLDYHWQNTHMLMMADHFVDNEAQEFFREHRVEVRVRRELAQPRDLAFFAAGVGGGQGVFGLETAHRLRDLESLGEHEHQRRVDIVDALTIVIQRFVHRLPPDISRCLPAFCRLPPRWQAIPLAFGAQNRKSAAS